MDQEVFIAKNKYISSKRSAKLYGYTHDYLSRLAKKGAIKGKKFGRAWYLEEKSLKDFIANTKLEKEIKSETRSNGLKKKYKKSVKKSPNLAQIPDSIKKTIQSPLYPGPQIQRALLSKPAEKALTLLLSGSLVFGVFFFQQTTVSQKLGYKTLNSIDETESFIKENILTDKPVLNKEKISLLPNVLKETITGLNINKRTTAGIFDSISNTLPLGFHQFSRKFYCATTDFFEWENNCIEWSFYEDSEQIAEISSEATTTPEVVEKTIVKEPRNVIEQIFVEGPTNVVERTVERVVIGDGVTFDDFNIALESIRNEFKTEIYNKLGNINTGNNTIIQNVYNQIAASNNIDRLDGIDLTASSISGAAITDSSFAGTSGTFTGNVTSNKLITAAYFVADSTTATSTFAGGLTVDTNDFVVDPDGGKVGIGTTSPSARFAVEGGVFAGAITATSTLTFSGLGRDMLTSINSSGQLVATSTPTVSHILATSTAATSTFAGNVSVGGSTGLYISGTGADLTFSGTGNHDISAENGTLRLGAFTLTDDIVASTGGINVASAGTRLGILYADEINATTLVGTISGGNVSAETVSINSDNASDDEEDSNLAFERGTVTPNALLTWDSTLDLFDFNQSVFIQNDSSTTTIVTLDVTGTAGQTADILQVASSSGTSLFNVSASGLVGIGTTSPYAKLSVVGEVVAPYYTATSTTATSTFAGGLTVDSTDFVVDPDAGRVGIGTAGPDYILDIENNGTSVTDLVRIYRSSGSNNLTDSMFTLEHAGTGDPAMKFLLTSGEDWIMGIDNSDGDKFKIGQAANLGTQDRFTIDTQGNVGIGTASPGAKLDIRPTVDNAFNIWETDGGNVAIDIEANTARGLIDLKNAGVTTIRLSGGSEASYFNVGNVGIGTTSPYAKLSVEHLSSTGTVIGADALTDFTGNLLDLKVASSTKFSVNQDGDFLLTGSTTLQNFTFVNATGTSATTTNLFSTTASSSNLFSSVLTVGGDNLVVTQSGLVGIGTTAPTYKLEVSGTGRFTSFVDATQFVATSTTATSTFAGGLTVDSTDFVVDPDAGRVGIGTASPGNKLHVLGTDPFVQIGQSGGSGLYGLLLRNGSNDTYFGQSSGNDAGIAGSVSGDAIIRTIATKNILFSTDGGSTADVYIESGGNVGIGIVDPDDLLHIKTTGAVAGLSLETASQRWRIKTDDNQSSNLVFRDATSPTGDRMVIDTSGNVGIGTTTPGALLDVYGTNLRLDQDGTGLSATFIINVDGTDHGIIDLQKDGATTWRIVNDADETFDIDDGTNVRLTIDSSGNVGIGTTSPYAKLSVVGEVVASHLTATSTTATSTFAGGLTVDSTDFVVDPDAGRVGIGTAGPESVLHVLQGSVGTVTSPNAAMTIESNTDQDGLSLLGSENKGIGIKFGAPIDNDSGRIMYFNSTHASSPNAFAIYTAGVEAMRINSSGNVGIGTTSPSALLEVNKEHTTTIFTGLEDASLIISNQDKTSSTNHWVGLGFKGVDTSGATRNIAGIFGAKEQEWTTTNSTRDASLVFATNLDGSLAEKMRITSSGNVGIGTTTPGAKLEINSSPRYDDPTSGATLHISNLTAPAKQVRIGYDNAIDAGFIQAAETSVGTKSLILQGVGGNVGIGTTSPDHLLHIFGSSPIVTIGMDTNGQTSRLEFDDEAAVRRFSLAFSDLASPKTLTLYGDSDGTEIVEFTTSAGVVFNNSELSTGDFRIAGDTDSNLFFADYSADKVGIGTAGPDQLLHISGTEATPLKLTRTDGENVRILFDSTSGDWQVGAEGGGGFLIRDDGNSQTRLVIDSSGLVGIGTTSPYAKLSVEHLSSTGTVIGADSLTGFTGNLLDLKVASTTKFSVNQAGDLFSSGSTTLQNFTFVNATGTSATTTDLYSSRATLDTGTITDLIFTNATGTSATTTNLFSTTASSTNLFSSLLTVGGTGLVVDASRNVGIGTDSPSSRLDIKSSGTGTYVSRMINSGSTNFLFGFAEEGPDSDARLDINDGDGTKTVQIHSEGDSYFNGGNVGIGETAPGSKLSVSGNVTVGASYDTTAAPTDGFMVEGRTFLRHSATVAQELAGSAWTPSLQVNDSNNGGIAMTQWHTTDDAIAAHLWLSKSGSATKGTHALVADNEDLGSIIFSGSDGTDFVNAAKILGEVDGAPGANDMPGRLTFWTTADGAAATSERMRIDSAGNVGIASSTTAFDFAVGNSGMDSGDTSFTNTSHSSFKENIVNFSFPEDYLSMFYEVEVKNFNYKEDYALANHLSTSTRNGLLADEFNPLIGKSSTTVTLSGDDRLNVMHEAIRRLIKRTNNISTATSTEILTIDADGNLGVGTTTPEHKLHVMGDVAATGFVNTSTRDAKKDIEYVTEEERSGFLDKIRNIGVAKYRYNKEEYTEKLRLGLIAEEAPEEVLSSNGKGVDIYKLTTFTLSGLQELIFRFDELVERISALEKREIIGASFDSILNSLKDLGISFAEGIVKITSLAVSNLTVGSNDKPTGITLYDEETGEPYCLIIANGQPKTISGTCSNIESDADGTQSGVETDNESPAIVINGNNPAQIELNATYVDLGASVTDNKDSNLGITAYVNGELIGNTGNILLDTSTGTQYTITYEATDSDGNTTTKERLVIIGNTIEVTELSDEESASSTLVTTKEGDETASSTPEVLSEEEPAESETEEILAEEETATSTEETLSDSIESQPEASL